MSKLESDKSIVEKCYYCTNKSKYTDVAEVAFESYDIVGVCQCHFVMEPS
jgi:hypothetical protein